jgi:RNA polymerase alpha subunit/pentapeptide repeat protein
MKTRKANVYDWASAMLALLESRSADLNQLAEVAELDPMAGDMSDMDCSDLDLSGQNLSGWDLRHATFAGARLTNTRLRNASLDPAALIEAHDWEGAELDEHVRAEAARLQLEKEFDQLGFNPALLKRIAELDMSIRALNTLRHGNILYIGDLVQQSEAELLRLPNMGRKAMNEIKEVLAQSGLHLAMEVPGWPPEGIDAWAKKLEGYEQQETSDPQEAAES